MIRDHSYSYRHPFRLTCLASKIDPFCGYFLFYVTGEIVVYLASSFPNLLGIIEVPGDRELYLASLVTARFGSDIQRSESSVLCK